MRTAFLSAAALLGAVGNSHASDPIVVHYYTQWSVWVRKFCAAKMGDTEAFRGVTHVQYAFHYPDSSCKITTEDIEADLGGKGWQLPCELECPGEIANWEDREHQSKDRGMVGCLRKLAKERGFQLGVSLGGWTLSSNFSKCVSNPKSRETMIDSIGEQIDIYGWDFIDFDWEYPQGGGNDGWNGEPQDWENFETFIKELKAKRSGVKLAAAVGINPHLLEGTKDYVHPTPAAFLCEELDYVSLMTYDMMGGWDTPTGWPAALYHDPAAPYEDADKLNVKWVLDWWKEKCGANFNKVVLGLPQYGKSWQQVPPGASGNGLYGNCSGTGWGMPCLGDGSFNDSTGTLELWDIHMNYLSDSRCKHYFHEIAKQDFVYCEDAMYDGKTQVWFAFDGVESMYEKTKLAKEMGAGGVMYWEPGYTWLMDDVNYGFMPGDKAAQTQARIAGGMEQYWWGPYDAAVFDAWEGKSGEAHRSAGIRVGDASGTPAPPPAENSTTTPPTTTTKPATEGPTTTKSATEAPSGGDLNCDEVSSASMAGVSESCMVEFCTTACKHFVGGECSGTSDAHQCVHQKFHELPPSGDNGIECQF